jgi:lariat debranching enzyme
MAVPDKYKDPKDFPAYFRGEKRAPILTVMIGGNHEASSYLAEVPNGGWLAPNFYYLGRAGVVRWGDLLVGGWSGIDKSYSFRMAHDDLEVRRAYHLRVCESERLLEFGRATGPGRLDVFLSHDWPAHIVRHGNGRYRLKRHLAEDATVGSTRLSEVMTALAPRRWYSAHLHQTFEAVDPTAGTTFLALDKALPGREHWRVVEVPGATEPEDGLLRLDATWLRTAGRLPCRGEERQPRSLAVVDDVPVARCWGREPLDFATVPLSARAPIEQILRQESDVQDDAEIELDL